MLRNPTAIVDKLRLGPGELHAWIPMYSIVYTQVTALL